MSCGRDLGTRKTCLTFNLVRRARNEVGTRLSVVDTDGSQTKKYRVFITLNFALLTFGILEKSWLRRGGDNQRFDCTILYSYNTYVTYKTCKQIITLPTIVDLLFFSSQPYSFPVLSRFCNGLLLNVEINRIARGLDASAKRETWQSRGLARFCHFPVPSPARASHSFRSLLRVRRIIKSMWTV